MKCVSDGTISTLTISYILVETSEISLCISTMVSHGLPWPHSTLSVGGSHEIIYSKFVISFVVVVCSFFL